jgi:hypothetical protein
MKVSGIKSAVLFLFFLFAASIAGAATLTVGPTEQYQTVCTAVRAASAGDTITIDYNNGIPYQEPYNPNYDPNGDHRSDCVWFTNNLTIVGVNGRPILDASGEVIEKGIFNPYGANNVISNLEFRNSATQPGQGDNGAAIRVDSGTTAAPAGGNITIQFCYIHDNEDGILTANVGPGTGGAYLSANPYITLLNDEFAYNGTNGSGLTHNMYIGYDAGNTEVFNLEYSWSHDDLIGHTVKSRAPINNVYYNLITDQRGATSYMLDFPLGGSTYIVGNSVYKSQKTNSGANGGFMLWRDVGDNTPTDPEYGLPLEDLHFVNNTVVLDPTNNTPSYVVVSCQASDAGTCAAPSNGPVLTVNAVVQNNIMVGPTSEVVNQTTAVQSHNLVDSNTPANLAALFVDWSHFNFHLVSGAPAINAGIYPPTDNAGNADPNALAKYEYVQYISDVARPTPSGSTMDEGAYSYPRADTPPSPGLSYTTSVTTPGTGTITLTGLPTPPAGKYNDASFVSGNTAVIPAISPASSTTGTITATFSACCASSTTTVPIDIYVDGAHLTASVTVVPGSVALQSITLDNTYYPETTVHLTNASSSPVVVDLTTTDPTILAVPSSVTIPAGQLSAETGSETGSLWGQTPGTKTATISAIYGGVTKTLPVVVYAPHVNHFYCAVYDPGCDVVGGNTVAFIVGIAGDFPAAGGPVIFTSDTPSVIPNQTFTGPAGNFYSTFNLTTNTVTTSTNVTISISVNGSTKTPLQVVTVTPASGTNVVVASGSGQSSPVGTNFSSPLAVTVTSGGSPVSGTTVTFAGSGVSFPGGSTAVTNSSGVAQVTAQPTAVGALTVTATVSGGNGPATFSETGTAGAPASIAVSSGSGQSAVVGTNFASPLVALVKDASNNPVSGATVTFAGTNVSFPGGATAVTNSSGLASVTAQPTAAGALTITASVAGVGTPASFSETGTAAAPASIAVSSGSGQSANVGTNFASPLVAIVKNSSGGAVSGATVTFAGTNVSFPGGATAVTNSSGLASVTAQPTAAGALTVTASVSGVGTPATFSETGTSGAVAISSITQDNPYDSFTTVHLTAAAPAGGQVVTLSTSNSSILYTPVSVTVPAGQTSAETGTLLGSLWGQSPFQKSATLTGIAGGATKTLTMNVYTTAVHSFAPGSSVVGGQPLGFYLETAFNAAPYGGALYSVSSDHPTIIPTQSFTLAAGQANDFGRNLTTNTVTTSTTVNVTLNYNGVLSVVAVTVTPGANAPASIAVSSGSGQSAAVGTNFASPLVAIVKNSSGGAVSGATVTFAGTNVSFPGGATAVTNSSGLASVTAQPTAAGSLTVTASVSGVGTPASFSETGTSGAVAISSITQDNAYDSFTTVHLVGPAPAGGQVVTLSTSNSSILYTPVSVTVPAGQTTAEAGTLLGSLWGQSPFQQSATLTGIAGGATKTLTMNVYTTSLHTFVAGGSVVGGQALGFYIESAFNAAPYGGALYSISSDHPSIIPTQSFTMAAGQANDFSESLTTHAVSTATTVNLTLNYNGATWGAAVTVNP